MGTLIQDAAEVNTIAGQIDTAIVAKGGSLVGGGKLRNAVAGINSISTGGWKPPSDWPNIRTILANDLAAGGSASHGLAAKSHAVIVLLPPSTYGYRLPYASATQNAVVAYKDDGTTLTYVNGQQWRPSTIGYHWIILYSDLAEVDAYNFLQYTSSGTAAISVYTPILWVVGDGSITLKMRGACYAKSLKSVESCRVEYAAASSAYYYQEFEGLYALELLKDVDIDTSVNRGSQLTRFFGNDYLIDELPQVDFSAFSTVNGGLLVGISSCRRVFDILDQSNTTSGGDFPGGTCANIENIPSVIRPCLSLSSTVNYNFSSCLCIDKDCIATFDESGEIDGGFAAFASVIPPYWKTGRYYLWTAGRSYEVGDIAYVNSTLYQCVTAHTAGSTFDATEQANFTTDVTGISSDATGATTAPTMTLAKQTMLQFTEDEQTAIEDAFTDHGWTLSW